MEISSDIKPVTYLKSNTADLLKKINETQRPVIITQNGEPRAVLQDPKSYDNMRRAIGILKLISQGEEDIRAGKFRPQQEVFETLEAVFSKKQE
jgi:prevent-host-death family protein